MSKHTRTRTLTGAIVLASSLLVPLSIAPAAHAAEDRGLITCLSGDAIEEYVPNLTYVPRTITSTTTVSFDSCTGTLGALAPDGFFEYTKTSTMSCLLSDLLGTSARTIEWDDGETSTISLTWVTARVGGSVTATGTGTFTAGKYAGRIATIVYTLIEPDDVLCLGDGIDLAGSGGSAATLAILPG
ncbi:hypothetical protein ACH436_14915 [Isoptericola sp. NPDC019693]|uniref:hypothetical protein n=1 Tax=Isoptericola sp. NPDC019693 TaxID=3364009 RepID=UPI00379E7CD7